MATAASRPEQHRRLEPDEVAVHAPIGGTRATAVRPRPRSGQGLGRLDQLGDSGDDSCVMHARHPGKTVRSFAADWWVSHGLRCRRTWAGRCLHRRISWWRTGMSSQHEHRGSTPRRLPGAAAAAAAASASASATTSPTCRTMLGWPEASGGTTTLEAVRSPADCDVSGLLSHADRVDWVGSKCQSRR